VLIDFSGTALQITILQKLNRSPSKYKGYELLHNIDTHLTTMPKEFRSYAVDISFLGKEYYISVSYKGYP